MGKEKVAYFYDAEIGNYHYGPGNMFMYCTVYYTAYTVHQDSIVLYLITWTDLKTLELWISRSMLDLLFLLNSRLI